MTIEEAIAFIHGVSWLGSRLGLERIRDLLDRLGNPQRQLHFVHIAGTNGKGSVAAMTASVLSAAGLKIGLYTSPYISRFNERMQINGIPISDAELASVTESVAGHARAMTDSPTEFELVTAIALTWFAQCGCDIVMLEVGMGGRLDATNVIDTPDCAVITNIGLDHTQYLGETLEQIAVEKAGIIKPGCDVVLYQQTPSVIQTIEQICMERGARLYQTTPSALELLNDSFDGQCFRFDGGTYHIPLLGAHQLNNAAVVLKSISILRNKGWNIPEEAVKQGFATTVWPARFEIICRNPMFVVDGGHNPQCAETVSANLKRYFTGIRHILLIGILADKDVAGMTDILSSAADAFVTITPNSPRALSAQALADRLAQYGKPITVCDSISEGVACAIRLAGTDGMVCSVGSLFIAGEVRACFGL
ncbi:MAG: bifunctional folylpolyglutamate synthase/dihydrofolate synthase [Oscillospiraceae bacterium]